MQSPEEIPSLKSRKKQSTAQKSQASKSRNNNTQPLQDVQPPVTSTKVQRPSKRTAQNLAPTSFVNQASWSPSDSLLDPSSDGAYRSLRRKYLMLEEESFLVSRETMKIEEQVRTLEDEKLALLDQLVVLEGLVDPSEC
ncbi:unnamed protein product [Rhodiola kirilowii]